jgi:hypothetical protein
MKVPLFRRKMSVPLLAYCDFAPSIRLLLLCLKIPPLPYSKGALKKIIVQIKLVAMFMIFECTELYSSKCNGSWVVSIKQNVNFKFQPPTMFYFCFIAKLFLYNLFILWISILVQNAMDPRWLVQVLHPPQKYERSLFWNGCSKGVRNYGVEFIFNGITCLLNFIKVYQLVQTLIGRTDTEIQTDRMVTPVAYSFPEGIKVSQNTLQYGAS